jgi:sodium/proline symporter
LDNTTWLALSFVVYTAFVISVGLFSLRRSRSTSADFVLANRELGPWVSALSASASSESGWVMLGLVGEAYLYGFAAFWIVPGIAAGYLFNWYVIADRLRQSTADTGAVTLTQYIMHRFGKDSAALRYLSAVVIGLFMLAYVAAQMNAAGKTFEATFSVSYVWGVLFGALIILAYTVTGGFRAVCWTDVVQATFMVIALIGMPFILISRLGGYDQFLSQAHQIDPDMLSFSYGKVGFAMLGFVIGLLGIGLGYPGQPHVVARFMATRDSQSVRKGARIALGWMVLAYLGAIFFGLFARIYYHGGALADPEKALPTACAELLPPIVGGFIIAAIMAAICSTADSQLMVVSSTISRDILPRLRKGVASTDQTGVDVDNRELRRIQSTDRTVVLVVGLLAVALAATQSRVIFDFVLYAWSGLGASFGPVVLLGLLWKRANKAGAIAGMLTGLIVTLVWHNVPVLKNAVYELVPAFVLSLLAVVIVSLVTQRRDT